MNNAACRKGVLAEFGNCSPLASKLVIVGQAYIVIDSCHVLRLHTGKPASKKKQLAGTVKIF